MGVGVGKTPARYDLLETVSQRVERAVSEIAEKYDLDPHTYLIRCPEKHLKLALELRPEDRDRSLFIGLIHAALFLDEYVDRSTSGQDTYVRNIEHHIRSLVVRTRQGGAYAIVHEIAESPFYQHIIKAGEHRTSHRTIHVGDDAIRHDDPE